MPNFSIHYSYSSDGVVHHKTAIVRASSPDSAKYRLVNFCTNHGSIILDDFKFIKISISSFNLVLS